jgi:proteic killer suppression protein
VIRSFRHRDLKRLFGRGDPSRVRADQTTQLVDALGRLATVVDVSDMNLPGYRLHRLKENLAGHWSVAVSGNWRIVFRFDAGDVLDVDLVDYH